LTVFFGLRVYALSNHSVLLFIIVFALYMVPFGINTVNIAASIEKLAALILSFYSLFIDGGDQNYYNI
jgi:hypothetical protein